MAVAHEIADGVRGLPETTGPWPAIDPTGTLAGRCEETRAIYGRARCLDARCDRCWSNLAPADVGHLTTVRGAQ